MLVIACHGGERLRRIWIVAVGLLTLAVALVIALVSANPEGGHTWFFSIQTAMKSAVNQIPVSQGGHAWFF